MNSYDPTDLIGQKAEREKEVERNRLANEIEAKDFRWLMSSKQGRRIVWRLLESAGVTRISFDTNALRMAFNEGNRNFGNKMLAQIFEICPELYPTMLKEQNDARSDGNGTNSN